MHFYEVWVRNHRYQNSKALTYQSSEKLPIGSLVRVPLQKEQAIGLVMDEVPRPSFACKPIDASLPVPPLPLSVLSLLRWLSDYYPAPLGPLTQLVIPANVAVVTEETPARPPQPSAIELNPAQQQAVRTIGAPGSYLLHGRTGSGKTRIYAALARQALSKQRSALILSPEISLTPQLTGELEKLVGGNITVFHSKLTPKERGLAWARLLSSTEPSVVVGPRSVLFLPLKDIGLIVLDEVHEPAYKQEQQPYYYAPRVAAKLAEIHSAKLVLGSATPPIMEYFYAMQKQRPIITLDQLASGTEDVHWQIVDMKDRDNVTPASPHISKPLAAAIHQALERGEQSLLYLNRRGTARLTLCQQCGWQAMCPRCDLPLAYHGDSHLLICHTCGYKQPTPTSCPNCGNPEILFRSAGTKAILDEVQRLFPEATAKRFDSDNTKADSLEQNFEAVKQGEVDILVGTQLLAKGLDLPKLSTLGVIMADVSLSIPDFGAQERTYQLLRQVIGRVGRGHRHGHAVIQTYVPESPTIRAALSDKWQDFYDKEIAERQQFDFPPFCFLLKLVCRRSSSGSSQKAAEKFAAELRQKFGRQIIIDGPAPAFHEKVGGKFYWQLVIKSRKRPLLLEVIRQVPKSGWAYDIDPVNLL